MKTVINIKSSSKAAKQMLEYLKTQHYIKIYDKNKPNAATLQAIEEAKTGKRKPYKNAEELIAELHLYNHSKK